MKKCVRALLNEEFVEKNQDELNGTRDYWMKLTRRDIQQLSY